MDFLKEYYEYSIAERLDHIRFIGSENKVLQEIREGHQKEWATVMKCEYILFENAKSLEYYLKGIENDRKAIKAIIWIRRRG